jgi:hypothetical protein
MMVVDEADITFPSWVVLSPSRTNPLDIKIGLHRPFTGMHNVLKYLPEVMNGMTPPYLEETESAHLNN